jgi:dipeptidyl aminopeptidase/acylaminoacyl peptidase
MRRLALLVCVALLAVSCKKPLPPPKPVPQPTPTPAKPGPVAVKSAVPDEPPAACLAHDKALAEQFAHIVDAHSNWGLDLSPDGKSLLLRSDRGGGSYQLYVASLDKPGADPIPIAAAKDAVADARFTPDGLSILFTRDKDRNENTQIFRASTDGKEVVPLTKAPERFHYLPRMKPDWKTLVYLRGLHKTGGVLLVSESVEGGAAKPIWRGKGFHWLADVSPDGKRALLFNLVSLSQSRLFAVDLDGGKVKPLAPKKEKASHAGLSAFAPDGKSVYVVTDEGMPRAGLNKIDAETGNVQATFKDAEAEVADVKVTRKAPAVVAVMLDYGSHSSLKILDGETLKEKVKVKVPMGFVSLGEFDPEGGNLVVNISTPSAPADVFVLAVKNGKLKAARRDKRPGLAKLPAIKASVEKVTSFDKTTVPVNLFLPKKLPRGKKLPVVVSVHGGPAASSTIRWNPTVSFLVSRGFVVVEPNVRGSTGFGKEYEKADNGKKRMDAVKDLAAVNAWVREQPWADPDKLVVMGGSYGGYMTYMALGHQPTLWKAGVGMVGVVNLVSFLRVTTGAIRMAFVEEFGDVERDRAFLREVSPITVVKQIKSPLFVYQGENDPRVPRSEQDQLVNALRRHKIPVEYMVAGDEGHSVSQRPNKLAFMSRSLRFLEQHLGLPGLPEGCSAPAPGEAKAAKPAKAEKPVAPPAKPAQPAKPAKPAQPAKPAK